MSCHEARASFPVFVAGRLSLTEWAEIEVHVRRCDGCGRALEQFCQVRRKDDTGRLDAGTARSARGLAVGLVAIVVGAGIGGYALSWRHSDELTGLQSTPTPARLSSPAGPAAPPSADDVSAAPAVPPERPAVTSSPPAIVLPPGRSTGSKMTSRNAEPKPPPASGMDVVVQLAAQDRKGAERDLTSLLARVGGFRLARDQRATMKVIVPRSSYGEFTRGLAQIGSWEMETRSASLPDPVRVAVRLSR